jgi:YD repeat-containing protein
LFTWLNFDPAAVDQPAPHEALHKGSIHLGTGYYIRRDEDLVVQGTPALVLHRTYRTGDNLNRPLGIGATHAFEWFVTGDVEHFQWTAVVLEDGAQIRFDRISRGTSYSNTVFEHRSTPTAYLGARLGWTGFGWTMRRPDGHFAQFEACGSHAKPRPCGLVLSGHRRGQVIRGRRDSLGRLERMEASDGRWIAFGYDEAHRVSRAHTSDNQEARYSYDAGGRLATVTTSDRIERRYGYTDKGQMQSITEPGILIENRFDPAGRCVRQVNTFPDGAPPLTIEIGYETTGDRIRRVVVRRSDGSWRTLDYGDGGYALAETWGRNGVGPTSVQWERDHVSHVVKAIRVTCPGRTGVPITYSRSVEPGGEEYAQFDLLRTHCGWTEFNMGH